MTDNEPAPPGLERGPDYVRLTMVGDVDASTIGEYASAVAEIAKDPPRTIAIDLSQVPFLDSSGIGLLASVARLTREHDVTILVADASPTVTEALHTCGLTDFITLIRSGVEGSEVSSQLREDASEET
jgi:anti-sigma B factor antagonist